MPAGFQVVGSHGVVQVDQNFINLGLAGKGTVAVPGANASGWMGRATVTVTGTSPILCLRPTSNYAAIFSVARTGNTYTYTIAGTPGNVAWYLFDRMSPGSAGQVGFEVRDANGITTFNSNFAPMIVAAIGQIPHASMTTTPASINTGVARTYAACMSEGRRQTGYIPPAGIANIYIETLNINATGASTSYGLAQQIPAEVDYDSTQAGQILLVDVTGL